MLGAEAKQPKMVPSTGLFGDVASFLLGSYLKTAWSKVATVKCFYPTGLVTGPHMGERSHVLPPLDSSGIVNSLYS